MGQNIYVGLSLASSGYGASNTSTFDNVSVSRTDHSLPNGWSSQDVGSASFAGSSRFYGDTFTFAVESSGQNVGGTSDAFHFAHRGYAGEGEFVARVASMQGQDGAAPYALAKGGVMFRDGMGADAKNVFIAITGDGRAVWQYRTATGGNTTETYVSGWTAPKYVKVTRYGNTFRGYVSADGSAWTQIGSSATISGLPQTMEVGLALSASGYGSLNTTKFDNIHLNPKYAPSNLTATAVHAHRVDLSWLDYSAGEEGFIVERKIGTGGTWTQIATVGQNATGYVDTTVNPGLTYYRVQAQVSGALGGLSGSSNEWSANTTGLGDGLSATYYDGLELVGASVSRLDTDITFHWANGQSPDASIAPDTFSAAWMGQVLAPSTGTYTFSTLSDDGVRLWLNDQLVIDHWDVHNPATDTATVSLTAGQKYNLRMEFFQSHQTADAHLEWKLPGSGSSVPIPTSKLFSTGNTSSAPQTPSVSGAAPTSNQINLTWNDVAGENFYLLSRSTDGGNTFSVLATLSAGSTSYTDNTVQSGSTYHYRLATVGSGGRCVPVPVVVTTPGPTPPSNLTIQAVSPQEIRLNWTDTTSGETGFRIRRSTDGVNFSERGIVAAGSTSFRDTGLTGGTTYYYRVSSYVGSNESSYQQVSTQTPVSGAPLSNGLTVAYYDSGDLSGSVARTETVANVDFNLGNAAPEGVSADFSAVYTGKIVPLHSEAYSFSTTADGGVRVWVDGKLVVDSWSDVAQLQGDANRDGEVSHADFLILRQHFGTHGGWEQGDFNGDGKIDFVDFQKMEVKFAGSQQPTTATTVQTVDLQANQQYDIRIEYFDETAFASLKLYWSSASQGLQIVPQSRFVTTVNAPITLTASSSSDSQIDLQWSSNLSGLTGYRVEYSLDGKDFIPATTLNPDETSVSDIGLEPGMRVYYRVIAEDATGDAGVSETIGGTTSAAIPDAPHKLSAFATAAQQVELSWWDYADYEDGFIIERSTDNVTYTEIARAGEDVERFTVLGLNPSTHYYFHVRAYSRAGESQAEETAEATTLASGQTASAPPAASPPAEAPPAAPKTELLVTWYGANIQKDHDELTAGNEWLKQLSISLGGTINTDTDASGKGLPWWDDKGKDALYRLLDVIDSNNNDEITQGEVDAVNVRMLAYSWGTPTAINVSRRLTDTKGRVGKYRLKVPVPVHTMALIDPVHEGIPRLIRHTHGDMKANVEWYYNWHQRKGGTSYVRYDHPNTNFFAGDYTYGDALSTKLKGTTFKSAAQHISEVNITTTAPYNNFEQVVATDFGGTLLDAKLQGKNANHDTAPLFAYHFAKGVLTQV